MTKKFNIEIFNSNAFNQRLMECALPFSGNSRVLEQLLGSLGKPPYNCQSVIFEYGYVDKDYQDEYAAFYCKAFKKYDSRCVRLHFFSVEVPRKTKWNFGKYSQDYLGYIVIRPTDLQRMGRTVLRPNLEDSNRQFIHCLAPFEAHILGEKLAVKGMPFIQQDSQVGACAQASLWMLARYMSRKFSYREYLPSEINQLAKANMALGRPLPAERGLNSFQILDALKGMGMPALLYSRHALGDCSAHIETAFPVDKNATQEFQSLQREFQKTVKLADIAYRYIESGLPVIIGTSNHALVAIGHTYAPSVPSSLTIQRIPAFYVNNDNKGPYREMPVFATSLTDYSFWETECVIAVLPHEVTLRGEEAEIMAKSCINDFLDQEVPTYPGVTLRDFIPQNINPLLQGNLDNLEYRTFLQSSVEFQASLRQDMAAGKLDRKVGQKLLVLDYPKYIWIIEASSSALLCSLQKQDRKCAGRVIVDSTAPAKTRGAIAMHVADFLQLIDRNTGKTESGLFPGSTPFGHKILA